MTARAGRLLIAALVLALALVMLAGSRTTATPRSVPDPSIAGWGLVVVAPGPSGASLGGADAFGDRYPRDGRPIASGAPSDPAAPPADHAGTPVVVPADDASAPEASMPVGLVGPASWYCGHGSPCTAGYPAGSMAAAAGPALRAALGPSWRGRAVTVAAGGRSVVVTLVDACQCHGTRLVDAYVAVWDALGLDLRVGLATVEVVG